MPCIMGVFVALNALPKKSYFPMRLMGDHVEKKIKSLYVAHGLGPYSTYKWQGVTILGA